MTAGGGGGYPGGGYSGSASGGPGGYTSSSASYGDTRPVVADRYASGGGGGEGMERQARGVEATARPVVEEVMARGAATVMEGATDTRVAEGREEWETVTPQEGTVTPGGVGTVTPGGGGSESPRTGVGRDTAVTLPVMPVIRGAVMVSRNLAAAVTPTGACFALWK